MACACATRLQALERRIAVLEQQARGRVDDHRELMRVLVASVGTAAFSAAELFAHQAVDRDLQVALARYPTAKRIGKRLRALADQPIAGFMLRRVTRDRHGTIWALQVAPDLHAGAGLGEDSGL